MWHTSSRLKARVKAMRSLCAGAPFDWSRTLIAICLPEFHSTLHFRPYEGKMGKLSTLGWIAQRFREETSPQAKVCVVCAVGETGRVRAALTGVDAAVHPRRTFREAHDLYAAASAQCAAYVLRVDLSAGLMPRAVWSALASSHVERSAQASVCEGLPCAATPVLIDAQLLRHLAEHATYGGDLLKALSTAAVQGRSWPMSWYVRVHSLTPLSPEEQNRRGWARRIRLDTPRDVTVCGEVQARCAEPPRAPAELPAVWAELARAYTNRQIAALRPRAHRDARTCDQTGPPRILFASCAAAYAGDKQVLIALLQQFSRQHGLRFLPHAVVAMAGLFSDRLAAAGAAVTIANRDFDQPAIEHYLFALALLNEVRPALVHANSFLGTPFLSAVHAFGVPFVQHVHVANDSVLDLCDQMRLADAVIAVSQFVKRRLVQLGVDETRIAVVPNGVAVPTYRADRQTAATLRETLEIPAQAPVVGMVARFWPDKRHDIMIESFAALSKTFPDAFLVCVGDTAEAPHVLERVRADAEHLGLGSRLRILGFQREMAPIYATLDVLACPGENEALPTAMLEAMAAGVPVAGVLSGAVPEIITDGVTGCLVAPREPDALAAAIARLILDAAYRDHIVEQARDHCRREFSLAGWARRIAEIYDRVVVEGERSAAASRCAAS